MNRITGATDNTGNYNLSSIAYDKNGNITALNRQGPIVENPVLGNASHFNVMDNLTYTYDNGNKLTKVADTGNTTFGFKDGTNTNNDFEYDSNGNLKIDRNKGITGITYNHLNLPTGVTINNSTDNGIITYIYDASGAKLQKIVVDNNTSSTITTDYAGNYVYENSSLKFFNQVEGYVEPINPNNYSAGFNYIYQYKDHLGNIRLSYSDTDGNGVINAPTEIIEENNYYPFGMKHKGYNNNVNGVDHPYGFNGKEENNELNLNTLDFGARNYQPDLGRWMNIDPLAEKYFNQSPFVYSLNNPIYFIDPDGKMVTGPVDPTKITEAAENTASKIEEDYGSTTAYCNFGSRMAFEELTGSKELYPESQGGQVGGDGKANDIYDYLGSSENWESVEVDAVQEGANDGEIIIGAWKNESNSSGHVVMAVPGDEVSSNWGGETKSVPQVMDTGYNMRNAKQGANYSFGSNKRADVKWYKFTGSIENAASGNSTTSSQPQNTSTNVVQLSEVVVEGTRNNNFSLSQPLVQFNVSF